MWKTYQKGENVRKDETDEMILKLFIALVIQNDHGMMGQINSILHMTKGRYVSVDQSGNVTVANSGDEIRTRWGNE